LEMYFRWLAILLWIIVVKGLDIEKENMQKLWIKITLFFIIKI
jgi:hypothetical protein